MGKLQFPMKTREDIRTLIRNCEAARVEKIILAELERSNAMEALIKKNIKSIAESRGRTNSLQRQYLGDKLRVGYARNH